MRGLLIFILSNFLFWGVGFCCDESNSYRYTNPDGSLGGLVSKGAKVEASVFIGFNARVCDQAWVEGNAKLLDQSVVKENSWIRAYSIIQGRAVVGGSAVVWGSPGGYSVVRDDSRVYGNAKILYGSVVSERAKIYGGTTLKVSSAMADAEVCEGYILNDLVITDDYFCNPEMVDSRAVIEPKNYTSNSFNKKTGTIKFISSGFNLSRSSEVFNVLINGNQVDPANIQTFGQELRIMDDTLQTEGFNKIQVFGFDEYGKKIKSEEFEFIVGSNSKQIEIVHQPGVSESSMSFQVTYGLNGKDYTGQATFKNGNVILEGLPANIDSFSVRLDGFGQKTVYSEKFDSLINIPSNISTYTLPDFIDNDTAFSGDLNSWKISHPAQVFTSVSNGKRILEIQPLENERIDISKKFKFTDYRAGLNLNFLLPQISKLFIDQQANVKIIFGSLKNKVIEVQSFDATSEPNLDKKISLANEVWNGEYFVLVRVEGSVALKNSFSTLKLLSLAFPDVIVEFYPYHLNALNRSGANLSPTTNLTETSCGENAYNLNLYPSKYRLFPDDIFKYFSVGPAWGAYDQVTENRIFGYLRVSGRTKSDVKGLTLVGVQDDIAKFEVPLATCANYKFNAMAANQLVAFQKTNNFVGHLFAVPFNVSPNPIDVNPGSKISLYVKAEIRKGTTSFFSISNEVPTDVLVYTEIAANRRFGGLDLYDTNDAGLYRTGGDRWILPAYTGLLKNILDANITWNINDLTKLNGGIFEPHASHDTGVDVDLRFTETSSKIFNFSAIENLETPSIPKLTKWKNALSAIENFLEVSASAFHVIETIFLTREDDESTNSAKWHGSFPKMYVMNQFHNRCIKNSNQTRYIDYREVPYQRTLLAHENEHWEHMHLKFNPPENNGNAKVIAPVTPDFDLDDLWFEIDAENRLVVSPQNAQTFQNFSILWRFQEEDGYDNLGMITQFGRWAKGSTLLESSSEKNLSKSESEVRYISVVFADRVSGGCVERKVSIDMASLDKSMRWSFDKMRGDDYRIVHEGRK